MFFIYLHYSFFQCVSVYFVYTCSLKHWCWNHVYCSHQVFLILIILKEKIYNNISKC